MTGTTSQAKPRPSPPHLDRIRGHVLAGLDAAPIVHLWGWPGSGAAALAEALAVDGDRPARFLRSSSLDSPTGPGDLASTRDLPTGDLYVVVEAFVQLDGDVFRNWVDRGGRLIVACPRRPLPTSEPWWWETSGLAIHRIAPEQLLLTRDELERAFSEIGVDRDRLWRTTQGWWHPCELLVDAAPASITVATCEPLHDWFRKRFLPRLDTDERGVLAELVLTDLVLTDLVLTDLVLSGLARSGLARSLEDRESALPGLDAWRMAQVEHPARLAALERLRHGWGLLPRDRPPALLEELPESVWGVTEGTDGRLARARALLTETHLTETPPESRTPTDLGAKSTVGRGPVAAPGPSPVTSRVRFEVRLFGEPEVVRIDAEGETTLRWRLRRALGTVLFLALAEGRRARKEALVEALWSEAEVGAVRRNFHPTLSEARRTLGAGLETLSCHHSVYSLATSVDWWVDAEDFEAAVEAGHEHRRRGESEAALECWRQAWKLYRGPLLAADESPWTSDPRHRFQELYLGMLRGIGELATRHDDPTLAIDAYRSLLLEEAYEEPVHRALMELYARRGRRDLVRRQFVRLQELLLDDLGIEPSVETQERYHELMR